ncbi:MAG: hypothetical protein KDC72_01135 [Bacteroidetes bacterium]|nr:hypothetical protein [Bacteroidota bacterium]
MANTAIQFGVNYINFILNNSAPIVGAKRIKRLKTEVSCVKEHLDTTGSGHEYLEYYIKGESQPYLFCTANEGTPDSFGRTAFGAFVIDSINGTPLVDLNDLWDKLDLFLEA